MNPITTIISTIGTFASPIQDVWNEIITALKGKKIAIFGARGTGKTTLWQYLDMIKKDGIETSQTTEVTITRTGSIRVNLGQDDKTTTIKFQKSNDLPGSEEIRDTRYADIFKSTDIVLYLINAYELLNNQNSHIQKRIEDDLKNMQLWMKEFKSKKKRVFVIGNHFDRIDSNFADANKIGKYQDQFETNEIISQYSIGMIKIIGTLKSRDTMKKIMEKVINNLD